MLQRFIFTRKTAHNGLDVHICTKNIRNKSSEVLDNNCFVLDVEGKNGANFTFPESFLRGMAEFGENSRLPKRED